MLLNELFNQPIYWTWGPESEGEASAFFATDTTPYVVSFVQHDNFEDPDVDLWDVEFGIDGVDYPKSMEVANTGNAPAVFATVIDIIRDFAKNHKGIMLTFSGKGASRTKLYDRLTKRLSPNVEVRQHAGGTSYRIRT